MDGIRYENSSYVEAELGFISDGCIYFELEPILLMEISTT